MSWFDRHIDRGLERWSLGELSPAQSSRLLKHAHACKRCGELYERWVHAHRVLEGGDPDVPTAAERATLESSGLEAALAAAAPRPTSVRRPALMALAGTLAMACTILLLARGLLPPAEDEWQARGLGVRELGAVLRIFCAAPGHPLRELSPGQTCPPGAVLAFAAGAEPPLSQLLVRVRGASWEKTEGPFLIGSRPGEEGPLEWTLPLPDLPGTVEVEAVFATRPEAALRALRSQEGQGEVVVRRQPVRVGERP